MSAVEPMDSQRMAIRFKCPHCKKPLAVKDDLAGKRATCPACKKPIVIPAPITPPADIEALAAAALSEQPAEAPKQDESKQIKFVCSFCDEPVTAPPDMVGKRMPCPSCRQILKVPLPKEDKPKDWRDIHKHGPTAAIVNLPEQLDGAWGTELKGRVGRESLEDAGAIQVEVEPVGIGGWIRRVLIAAAVIGFVSLIVIGVTRSKTREMEKTTFGHFWDSMKKLESLDAKKKPHPALLGEVERLEGEMFLWKGERDKAMAKFKSARALATSGAKDADIDGDFFLVDLARTQLNLGGTEDEIRAKSRFDWDREVLQEVKRTLDKIKNNEVKVIAVRELSSDLIARQQVRIAMSLATGQYNPAAADKGQPSPVLPQLTALIFAHGDAKEAPLKPLDPAKPGPTDVVARLAYAEGNARKGNTDEARKLVDLKGLALHNLEVATSVAAVLLSDKSDKAAASKAAPFVETAIKVHKGDKYPPWYTLQLCRAAFRVPDQAVAAKDLGLKLPGNFKRRAQLEWIYAHLEREDAKVSMELVKDFPDPGGAARTLAWIALARHLGKDCELPAEGGDDAEHREFVKIGQLVGKPRQK